MEGNYVKIVMNSLGLMKNFGVGGKVIYKSDSFKGEPVFYFKI